MPCKPARMPTETVPAESIHNRSSGTRLLDISTETIEKYRGAVCGRLNLPRAALYDLRVRYSNRCGITNHLTWHMSRHTMATEICLTNGVPIKTVSSILGHKNITTTQIYTKITNEKLNRDMDNLSMKLNNIEENVLAAI